MKTLLVKVYTFSFLMVMALSCPAADYYVVPPGASQPEEPWSGWETAHTNLLEVIAQCQNGDTVYLTNQAAYYITNQIDISYGIEVRSCAPDGSLDPETTILNGSYPLTTNRIFYLNHDDAWIKGLTLSNACWHSTATTSPWQGGGAVCILKGHLTNCYLLNNRNTHNYDGTVNGGGALFMGGAHAYSGTVWNCVFRENISTNNGGGAIQISYGTWEIHNCEFSHNETHGKGGGAVRVYYPTSLVVRDCQFLSNTSREQGGGLMHSSGKTLISGCLFYDNTGSSGGGVHLRNNSSIQNCLIYGNTARDGGNSRGGGVEIAGGPNVLLRNCTIAGNQAKVGGGVGTLNNAYMENCIVWGNTCYLSQPNYYFGPNVDNFQMTNCCVSPDPANYSSQCVAVDCIADNPQFEDADTFKFNLLPGSPCINTGFTRPEMLSELDYGKAARVDRFTRKVDIGAYEYHPAGILFRVK